MKPQVEKLIVGNAVATETTFPTFMASASDKEIKVLSATGGAPAVGKDFKVYQKTANGFEFSDIIKADQVELVKVVTYKAEVQKKVTVSGFTGNVQANTLYSVEVRLYNDGGSLSVENFSTVSGYFQTGANIGTVTAANIRDGIMESLQSNFTLRGDNEVIITAVGANLVIEGKPQTVVLGRIEGRQIEFDVTAKVYDIVSLTNENLGLLIVTVNTKNHPGNGTGKYAQNLEWFTQGFDNEVYRGTSYPVGFNTPYYTTAGGIYNVIHIFFYDGRNYTTVERQHKLLTILADKGTDTLANNATTNAILADLRTILGTDNVPVALSVI
jgi:hypothetical protein